MTTTAAVPAERLRALIADEIDELISIRRFLHANPELAYDEHRTAETVRRELGQAGVEYQGGLAGGTGVLGHLPGEGQAAIGLRADMDALPITEQTDAPHASINEGVMHACGHDGHTTILLGAARILARVAREQALPRPVTFVFQPAEEGGAGGKKMVEEGCLDGSVVGRPVAQMFGLHGWPRVRLGVVGTRVGPLLAASDKFRITVSGTGTHAAFPHLGRDPVVAASAVVTAIQTIASRNADPLDAIVVSATSIHGGSTFNVIPHEVKLTGTVRTLVKETQKLAITRLTEVAERTAAAHDCRATVDYEICYPVTLNDARAVEVFDTTARASLGDDRVEVVPHPFMGGEDFSYYCHKVPSCFFLLGLRPDDADEMPDLHQPTFDFNDDALATGIEMFCQLALRAG